VSRTSALLAQPQGNRPRPACLVCAQPATALICSTAEPVLGQCFQLNNDAIAAYSELSAE